MHGRPLAGRSLAGRGLAGRGLGAAGDGSGGGVFLPTIVLSATSIAENAADNSVVGTLSVVNGSGTYAFAITADPDNKFAIANDDELQIDELLDFETATSHQVTIEADNSVDPVISRTFTITVTDVDDTAPTLQTKSPADNATGVASTANIIATFSENIAFGTGAIELYDADDDLIEEFDVETDVGTGAGEVSIAGAVLTINPTAAMEQVKGHYILIDATAIDDLAGNSYAGISDKTVWNWTTADETAPTVSTRSPADNATDVAIDATLVATFNETVTLGASGTISLKRTSDNVTVDSWNVATDEGAGAGQVEVLSDDELTLHLTADLDFEEEYYVIWDAGVVEDGAGNPVAALSSTTTWSFTTEADTTTRQLILAPGVYVNSVASRQIMLAPGVYLNEGA